MLAAAIASVRRQRTVLLDRRQKRSVAEAVRRARSILVGARATLRRYAVREGFRRWQGAAAAKLALSRGFASWRRASRAGRLLGRRLRTLAGLRRWQRQAWRVGVWRPFEKWRSVAAGWRHLRLQRRRASRLCVRHFNRWCAACKAARGWRHLRRARVIEGLRRWRLVSRRLAKRDLAATTRIARVARGRHLAALARRFSRWRDDRRLAVCRLARRHLRRLRALDATRRWRGLARLLAEQRVAAARLASDWRRKLVCRWFGRWLTACTFEKAVLHFRRSRIADAARRWRQVAKRRGARRAGASRLSRRVLRRWQRVARHSRAIRAAAIRLSVARRSSVRAVAARAFARWRAVDAPSRAAAIRLSVAYRSSVRAVAARAFARWRAVDAQSRAAAIRLARGWCRASLALAFAEWRAGAETDDDDDKSAAFAGSSSVVLGEPLSDDSAPFVFRAIAREQRVQRRGLQALANEVMGVVEVLAGPRALRKAVDTATLLAEKSRAIARAYDSEADRRAHVLRTFSSSSSRDAALLRACQAELGSIDFEQKARLDAIIG